MEREDPAREEDTLQGRRGMHRVELPVRTKEAATAYVTTASAHANVKVVETLERTARKGILA